MHPVTQRRIVLAIVGLVVALSAVQVTEAQVAAGAALEVAAAPGDNYDKAEFRLWYQPDAGLLRAVVVLAPGSNGDGRSMVDDPVWRDLATRHHLALVGCRFTDKPHEQGFIEHYAEARRGSGQALLDALVALAGRSTHPELAGLPLLMWGMSAGGQFNYEFVAWQPDRVAAFVVNKGGIYYTALVPQAARNVPGLLFTGGKDLEFRTNTIVGLFAVNRRAGALWALADEPGAAHVVGRSRDMAVIFFEDVLALRLGGSSPGAAAPGGLAALSEKGGFIGDLHVKTFEAAGESAVPSGPTAWLPTVRVARAWQALVTEKPFER